ncbi:MAG: hypothetical protein WBB29_12425 [Geitlerinemataceae cyanobacterium]
MVQPKLFNHDIGICTHESVVGNHLYSGRALGLTEVEDTIQLHPELRSQFPAITAHYDRIGLTYSKNVIWDVSLQLYDRYPNLEISVFYFGDTRNPNSPQSNWFKQLDPQRFSVVESIDSKNNFMQISKNLGVAVPKTFCFDTKTEISNLDKFPYPCYLKPAVAVAGAGIHRCDNAEALASILQKTPNDIPLQIQEEVIASSFLNLQYQVTDSGWQRLAATFQILKGYTHIGNRYPSPHQPWELVDPMAEWMAQQGMKEVFAFDVAVVEEEEKIRYLAIECNPRFNGASYPTGIANKLKIDRWSGEVLSTQYRSLDEIDLSGIEFNSQTQTGVVLVNWGVLLVGHLGVLLAGSVEEQEELRSVLKQRL